MELIITTLLVIIFVWSVLVNFKRFWPDLNKGYVIVGMLIWFWLNSIEVMREAPSIPMIIMMMVGIYIGKQLKSKASRSLVK